MGDAMSDWIDVAGVYEIGPKECKTVLMRGVQVAVFNIEGGFFAIEDECSHEASPLSDGSVEGDIVICAKHGARFSLRNGEALSPPAYEPVAIFPVRIQDGRVQVRDNRWD